MTQIETTIQPGKSIRATALTAGKLVTVRVWLKEGPKFFGAKFIGFGASSDKFEEKIPQLKSMDPATSKFFFVDSEGNEIVAEGNSGAVFLNGNRVTFSEVVDAAQTAPTEEVQPVA